MAAYQKLADRLASLPVVICGPMLRRVTTQSVTVFVALRESRSVTLKVYELGTGGAAGAERLSGTRDTVAIGTNLHVVAVTATGAVVPNTTYVYDVRFSAGGGAESGLMDAGVVAADAMAAKSALTYRGMVTGAPALPSFTAPPPNPAQLRIVHYSCRKPHGPARDALPTVDDMIKRALQGQGAEPRPHLLVHTGDQIYADDVADALLHVLIDASDALLGWNPGEVIPVPSGAKPPSQIRPGRRESVAKEGKLTSEAARSHLLGFGEFCAMYLHAWSPALWPLDFPTPDEVYAGATPDELETHREHYGAQHVYLTSGFFFYLPFVRRLLANVPSLMQFDDHEVTDDWFRNMHWLRDAQDPSKPAGVLGRTIVRNGLASYAVFQAWGNTPERFVDVVGPQVVPGAEILSLLGDWNAAGGLDDEATGDSTLQLLEACLGMPMAATFASGADRPATDTNRMAWHFHHEWPGHQLIVLDTRTMRVTPGGGNAPPALIRGATAYAAQLGDVPQPGPADLVIVVSPAPVFGAQMHEMFAETIPTWEYFDPEYWSLQPAAVQELFSRLIDRRPADDLGVRRSRVVVLAGDVHYAFTLGVRYHGDAPYAAAPKRAEAAIAQLTSSAAKNQETKTEIIAAGSRAGGLRGQRIYGWANPSGGSMLIRATVAGTGGVQRSGSPVTVSQGELMNLSTPIPTPEWIMDVEPVTDLRDPAQSGRPVGTSAVGGGRTPGARVTKGKWLESAADAMYHRRVVGLNNVGDISFRWGAGDAKSVVHRLWFRLRPGDLATGAYTEHIVDLRVGEPSALSAQRLRLGDHDRDAGGVARYDGVDRAEAAPGSGLVRLLQNQLVELGFSLVGTPDGVFAESTEEAVREFQIYAALPQAGHLPGLQSGLPDDHVAAVIPPNDRYPGAATGVVDAMTAAALTLWGTNNWRCPVVARSLQGAATDQDNIWWHDDVTDSTREVVTRDLSGAWSLPTGRSPGAFHPAGRYVAGANKGPVALAPDHVWPQAEALPPGPPAWASTVLAMDAAQRSTFKVIRAISERECMGFLDSVSTSDSAVLEAGLFHWTFGLPAGAVKAPGELAGLAAFLEYYDAAAFGAVFTRFGLRPLQKWNAGGAATGRSLLTPRRTYVDWWARPDTPTLPIEDSALLASRFRTWHWVHRFQMAARTLPAFRRAMFDFARIRVRDVLTTPWGKTTGADGVPDIAGRAAMIGDVVTTERAVALLVRWHVFRPLDIVSGNASGPVLRAALTTAGRPTGAPDTWPDSFDQQLTAALMATPPAAIGSLDDVVRWPRWHATNPRGYTLPIDDFLNTPPSVPPGYTPPGDLSRTGGLLSATRGSFLLDASWLPPAPDYTQPGQP